ncbi:hypothetical protein FACS189485_13930 [Spirochaetia bacterium]|nr:hypothetical protein FACS189485_13930 [Spirochaetia bacterium]
MRNFVRNFLRFCLPISCLGIAFLLSRCDLFKPLEPYINEVSSKEITAFSFSSPAATGAIDGTDITVTVPLGTSVISIAPQITHTGVSISPASGEAGDFTDPVTYTVTAEDGSTRDYRVTVKTAKVPSAEQIEAGEVAYLEFADDFSTLQDTIDASDRTDADHPATIFLYGDIDVSNTIDIDDRRHIRLIAGGGARAINRGADGFGSLITVAANSSLELGGDLPLTIDGKKGSYTATGPLITVEGTLIMRGGAVKLMNNNNINASVLGGGVCVSSGTFTMEGGSITGNMSLLGNGGGVFVDTGSTFTMKGDSSITGNNGGGDGGGGVYVVSTGSTTRFTMEGDSSITGNTTSGSGGGVYISGSEARFTMSNGSITGNSANSTNGGGGVFVNTGSTFIMEGGSITDNNGGIGNSSGGGGVFVANGSMFTMGGESSTTENTTITGNTTQGSGGGVYVISTGSTTQFTMKGGSITRNFTSSNGSSTYGGGGVYIYTNANISSDAQFIMNGGLITGNLAGPPNDGGSNGNGVHIHQTAGPSYSNALFTMNGGFIGVNSGSSSGKSLYKSASAPQPTYGGTLGSNPILDGNWTNYLLPYDRDDDDIMDSAPQS